jgi:hypothetical protein
MACGTPVIASRRGSVPEIVEEGVSGFVVDTIEEAVTAVGRIGRVVFGQAHLRRILGKYAAIIMNRAFIARWGMLHSIGRLSASASSHPGLSLAAFITNIAESDFRYTHRMKDQLSKASAAWVVSQFEFWAI